MLKHLKIVFLWTLALVFVGSVQASNHIVISEIMVGGEESALEEFIELYNPTSEDVDLDGWRLTRKTSTGTESNLVANMSGTIPAHGFFLITHPNNDDIGADLFYSATTNSVTNNNTVLLYSDASETLVDKVGMGEAGDFESAPAIHPEAGQSIERKAKAESTTESMTSGADQFLGNGYDTDNNANDFVLRLVPQPQNSQSPPQSLEEDPGPTPTPTPSPSPEPSPSPSPTPSPTPTPTPEPSPTPTPTPSPSPDPTPVPTPEPTPTPTPGPTPPTHPVFTRTMTCEWQPRIIERRFFTLIFHRMVCSWN